MERTAHRSRADQPGRAILDRDHETARRQGGCTMNTAEKHPLTNYHSHTWRCQHAGGTEEEYVRQAIETGFSVLGFADHSPWPYASDFVSDMRMRLDQFADYERTVRGLAARYADQIHVPLGLECESFPMYFGWLADFKAEHLDYVIMGNHYDFTDEGDHDVLSDAGGFYFGRCTTSAQIRRYADRTIAGMRTGLFDYVAHPDLFCHTYATFDDDCRAISRDLCAAAEALDIPLEYNLLGVQHAQHDHNDLLGYPCARFWEVASDYNIKAIIGFDAHQVAHLTRLDLWEDGRRFLTGLGIPVLSCLDKPGLRP